MNIRELNVFQKSDQLIKESFRDFLNQPNDYKNKFLQSQYKTAFDGYSFLGQTDSLNQYDTDLLFSFVLSEFQPTANFPKEFKEFLNTEWKELIAKVRESEIQIIKSQNSSNSILELYEKDAIGYMMSCNYYPKPKNYKVKAKENTRLSAHTDVSLFTTFPFGIAKGFSYLKENKPIALGNKEKTLVFNGYFSEFITNGKIKALNHQVELPKNLDSERFSFAIFSIPKPNSTFQIENKTISGEEYYKQYLSLF